MRKAQPDSKTKQKLLNAAETLMLTKGFAATSVEEICAKAKLTKGSFFHYFSSKDDLGKIVLERFGCYIHQGLEQECSPTTKSRDPLKRVYHHVDFFIKMARQKSATHGCLLAVFAQELTETHPKIRSLCSEIIKVWAGLLQSDLREAKKKYAPRATFDPRSVADYFLALVEGSQILSRVNQDEKIFVRNMNLFRQYVKELFLKGERT